MNFKFKNQILPLQERNMSMFSNTVTPVHPKLQVNNQISELERAMDLVRLPIMMIDRDLVVTYVNNASKTLFRDNLDVFRKIYPGTDFEKLIGVCIDVFHKNPKHQRELLANPDNLPYSVDIAVENLTFNLNVSAVINESGTFSGCVLEWENVTEVRKTEIMAARFSGAMNGMTTNLMMSDVEGNILFANPAVLKMLTQREAELQKVLPAFSVAKVVGSNYDIFHKNPAHQQGLLTNPENLPYEAEIKVADLEFRLIATALYDGTTKHIGTAVQWMDITDEKRAIVEVNNIIEQVVSGNLQERLEAASFTGYIKEIAEGINAIIANVSDNFTVAQNYMDQVAAGDLSQTLELPAEGDFKLLENSINNSITNIRSLLTEIGVAADQVSSASRELSQGNVDLSQRTEEQASSLEQTASAMEQFSSAVKLTSDNANEANELAADSRKEAENGNEVLNRTNKAMEEIANSSRKIADIISVIDDISFQTNLLALNAAVEAARAGEHGRGFAVVASEVRNLAGRSANAAKEIKELITESLDTVDEGTRLSKQSSIVLEGILSKISDVSSIVRDISTATGEQASGVDEVNQAIAQMDKMTQQNAALVEETAAASESMEEQAQTLTKQISQFDVGAEGSTTVQNKESNVSRPVPAAETVRTPGDSNKGNLDEWEEF